MSKYKDEDELKELLKRQRWESAADLVMAYGTVALAPTVDAVEVVRCKDCKHNYLPTGNPNAFCAITGINDPYGFCSAGKKRG